MVLTPKEDADTLSIDINDSPKDHHSDTMAQSAASGSPVATEGAVPRRPSFSQRHRNSSTKKLKLAPFWSLYKFSDRWDVMFNIVGIIGAIANG